MNGLIPALLAVLLAEVGPRGASLAAGGPRATVVFVVAAVVAGSAVGGGLVAPTLAPAARALLIAVALGFGAWAQVGRLAPATTTRGALFAFWRGGTALLVFALATWFPPVSVLLGAALALVVAALAGVSPVAAPIVARLRRPCAAALLAAAAIIATLALRGAGGATG